MVDLPIFTSKDLNSDLQAFVARLDLSDDDARELSDLLYRIRECVTADELQSRHYEDER